MFDTFAVSPCFLKMIILDIIGSESKKFSFKTLNREWEFYAVWKTAHDAADYEKKVRIKTDDGEVLVLEIMRIRSCVIRP